MHNNTTKKLESTISTSTDTTQGNDITIEELFKKASVPYVEAFEHIEMSGLKSSKLTTRLFLGRRKLHRHYLFTHIAGGIAIGTSLACGVILLLDYLKYKNFVLFSPSRKNVIAFLSGLAVCCMVATLCHAALALIGHKTDLPSQFKGNKIPDKISKRVISVIDPEHKPSIKEHEVSLINRIKLYTSTPATRTALAILISAFIGVITILILKECNKIAHEAYITALNTVGGLFFLALLYIVITSIVKSENLHLLKKEDREVILFLKVITQCYRETKLKELQSIGKKRTEGKSDSNRTRLWMSDTEQDFKLLDRAPILSNNADYTEALLYLYMMKCIGYDEKETADISQKKGVIRSENDMLEALHDPKSFYEFCQSNPGNPELSEIRVLPEKNRTDKTELPADFEKDTAENFLQFACNRFTYFEQIQQNFAEKSSYSTETVQKNTPAVQQGKTAGHGFRNARDMVQEYKAKQKCKEVGSYVICATTQKPFVNKLLMHL